MMREPLPEEDLDRVLQEARQLADAQCDHRIGSEGLELSGCGVALGGLALMGASPFARERAQRRAGLEIASAEGLQRVMCRALRHHRG
jgi:hypothetical protein